MGDANALECILNGDKDPTDLPLELLKDITDNFSEERKIGQGGFGAVYKGVLGSSIVAVKRIDVNVYTVDDKSFRREVTSLMKINHNNVVRFLGFCSNTQCKSVKNPKSGGNILVNVNERLLCLEYISNGSLDKHITDELRGFQWETRYEIITGICKGLLYLHNEKKFIHMDLKPANILLAGKDMVPKITDFGLSRPDKNSHTVGLCFGTLGYVAPEYMDGSETIPACDVYSLGIIILELVTGCKDIPDRNKVLRRWRHRWSKQPPTVLQYQQVTRCIEIAVRCRERKPEARPPILEIISLLNESESTDGHAGQEKTYLDDDMLGIEPLELCFTPELNKEMSWPVKLTNKTKAYVAFNIETPSHLYTIRPDKGVVPPECNEYLVQIILQAEERARQVTKNADKLVVQSTTVSNGLRDEDITAHIFHEEAGKIVDEVNLMVVYEPTKLGSSGNTDVASPDINSSAQEQCVRQTEQCNLHPLQSFSRHYPTNRKYLGRESDRAVDLARGAMGSLLDKLGKLVTEDYNLEKSIKRDIESFSEDLTIIHRDLSKLENVDEAKIWVNKVRELSYNIEDMVDNFLVHVEPDSSRSGFRELRHEGLNLLVNGMPTHDQIDDVIRDIKNQIQAVADRKQKFDVNNVVAYATAEAYIDNLRNLAIYEDKEELIGIEAPISELISLFEEDGDVSQQNLKIVSIVGLGGLGKTTLAKAVYDKLQAQYHTRAFVPVGRNPDVKEVLKNIISELEKDFNAENMDVRQLIKRLNELLHNKRYFIVIDDLWDSEASLPLVKEEAWSIIKYALPRNKHGSRVITTTRNHDVALACCNAETKYVYRMKPLSAEISRRLFCRRTFGLEKDCLDTLQKDKISIDILKICRGMPLAINSIASLLAGKPETTWEYVWKSLGALTEGNSDLVNMKQILDLSYIHLPGHLKTCLLYVCLYPEDREIDKNDLLRQWIAEGFVHVSTNSSLDAEDVAENYFKTLINMCMIEPGKIDYNNEVLSCTVHDIILDLMRSKSSEVNFIHVIDGLKPVTGQICRVSVLHNDKEDNRILETIKGPLSHARSVLLYRRSLLPDFLTYQYVRVLHLEDMAYMAHNKILDLTSINKLFLLRYLKVALHPWHRTELMLPGQIGVLQQLETIDLQACELKNYPSDIVSLPWLSQLIYDADGIALPEGVDKLKSLRTLVGVSVYKSSVDSINGLSKLTNLRRLQLCTGLFGEFNELTSLRMAALLSSINKLSASLRILSLGKNMGVLLFSGSPRILPTKIFGSISSIFPHVSNIRELNLGFCSFQRCPEWIGQLNGLYKLTIAVREVANVVTIVASLSSLAYFSLYTDEIRQIEETVVFPGSGAFRALRKLIFRCPKASLTFEEGTMPNLEKLEIWFPFHLARQFLPVGIKHLQAGTLKKIRLCMDSDDRLVKGSESWNDDDWRHERRFKSILARAFKLLHPAANITLHFEDSYSENETYDSSDYDNVDEEDHCCSYYSSDVNEEDYGVLLMQMRKMRMKKMKIRKMTKKKTRLFIK